MIRIQVNLLKFYRICDKDLLAMPYVFKWEHIPQDRSDNDNLKRYLRENFPNLEWIEAKPFIKSPDGKTIKIHDASMLTRSVIRF